MTMSTTSNTAFVAHGPPDQEKTAAIFWSIYTHGMTTDGICYRARVLWRIESLKA